MIDRNKVMLYLLLLVFSVCAQSEKPNFSQGDEEVQLELVDDTRIKLTMNEYNDVKNTTLCNFQYNGDKADLKIDISDITIIGEKPTYQLYTNVAYDYEKIKAKVINFVFKYAENKIDFALKIINIDDEPPRIECSPCEMKENTDYSGDETCKCSLYDDDLEWMDKTSFKFDYNNTFDFKVQGNGVSPVPVYITTKEQLDYETKMIYIFDVTLSDTGGNTGTGKVIINVVDMDDMPPIWETSLTTKQFDEKQEQTFMISARDGDVGINNDIIFKIDDPAGNVTLENNAYNKNNVTVKALDRDWKDITDYTFTLTACEIKDKSLLSADACIPNKVTFVLNDIDDQKPLISMEKKDNSDTRCVLTKKVFLMDTPKALELNICEGHESALPLKMTVEDRDTGDNALFDLTLEGEQATVFQIIPNAGYKNADFSILVKDASLLDYENPEWRNIKFKVLSKGHKIVDQADEYDVSINLVDWNDEVPKFEPNNYKFDKLETIEKGEEIGSVTAIDKDEGDIITYAIVGNDKLHIDENGKITVNVDNAFDYDILKTVIFQVIATDTVNHTSSPPAQVQINLIDVDNKPPVIAANGIIEIEENKTAGCDLNATITASKTFEGSKLTAKIDWDNSAVKSHFRKLEINDEMKCVDLHVTGENTKELEIRLVLNQDGPDYELFDTINLVIVVTDQHDEEKYPSAKEAKTTIVISISDINDNPPVFTEETLKPRSVTEGNGPGTSAGVIVATDIDFNPNITYSIKELKSSYDWIEVNEKTGALTLKGIIDADTDKLYSLNYTITAFDGIYNDIQEIRILIKDTNNKKPVIKNLENNKEIFFTEEDDTSSFVIEYEDNDRDEPYHTVECGIINEECSKYFKVYYQDAVNPLKMMDKLKREDKETPYECSLKCHDNPHASDPDDQYTTDVISFKITLLDINNNVPDIIETNYEATENIEQNGIVTEIVAFDPDKDENGTVSFKLINTTKLGEIVDLFDIKEISDKKANLVAKKSMEDHYGKYIIQLEVSDHGAEPLKATKTLTLNVEKYNFRPPRFIFPDSDITRALKVKQNVNEPLKLSTTEESLQNIEVSYLTDKPCGDKYSYTFKITDGDSDGKFKLSTKGNCKTELQITDKYQAENDQYYQLTITATINGDLKTGEASGTNEAILNLKFFEIEDPFFNDPTPETIKMLEEKEYDNENFEKQKMALDVVATFGAQDYDEKQEIYYYLLEDEMKEFFEISHNKTNILVQQLQELHYEKKSNFSFTIAASKSEKKPTSQNEKSNLPVTVEVIDLNNHAPVFPEKQFVNAVMYKNKLTTVVSLEATDIDTVANVLTYSMGDIEPVGENIDKITDPFILDPKTGDINQNFDVAANMKGYFLFNVSVEDQKDDYGNGPLKAKASVKILIIVEENIVVFRFDNDKNTVVDNARDIMQKITDILGFKAQYTSIDEDKTDSLILVSVFFINGDTALLGKDILKKIADVEVYKSLKTKLRELNIQLQNFPTETYSEDLTTVLKTWLIGVSVVLSALCLILLIAFVLKTRQLSNRITKLTANKFGSTESKLNRLGVNAPNTNQHAVEGANPVYKKEKLPDDDIYDKKSINSGDSDLIGIEDNADFDFKNFENENENRPSYTQFANNLNNRKNEDDEFGKDFDI